MQEPVKLAGDSRAERGCRIFLFLRCHFYRDDNISFDLDERAATLFRSCTVPCLLQPEIPPVDNHDCCVVCEGPDSCDRLLDPEHEPDSEGFERACTFSNPFQHEADMQAIG